ncbi:MAG: non-heme iron oxygenase ferredoxin subunit [Acidimicrobiia bacterium]
MADVRACSVADVASPAHARFDLDGVPVCVVHIDDEWFAINDTCSHEDYSLSEGDLWVDEREMECWKHGSTFSLLTGEPQCLPATKPVSVYPVRVDGDQVIVTLP